MELVPEYTEENIDISEWLVIDPSDPNAGKIEDIYVFRNDDGSWIAAPGDEDAFEEFLAAIG